jgi:two-component system sensor kinase
VIAGYRLLEPLGRGSSASVYRAAGVTGEGSKRQVAVKLLRHVQGSDVDRRMQFEHEATLLARLAHPGIVRLLSHGVQGDEAYLVTELAPGRSLAQIIAARGALEPIFVAEVLRQVALALAHAHGERILHRDIKPSNIVVIEAEQHPVAKLLDFGFAYQQGTDSLPGSAAIGTFLYMSPEQLGLLTLAPDERSDLYALGIVAIEMLAGRHPYAELNLRDLIHAHAAIVPEIPAAAPRGLAQIAALLVRKDPADRYRTAEGLASDLEACLARLQAGDESAFKLRTHDRHAELCAPRYFGRSPERAVLSDAYAAAHRGLEVVAVAGISGIGKTRLIGEAARGWTHSVVLWGRGRAFGQTAGYGLMAEALRALPGQALTPPMQAAVRAAVGSMGGEVLALAPELRGLLGDAVTVAPLEPEHQQQRLFTLLSAVLATLGTSDAPLVLILDDLQWADDGSLQFALHLARRIDPCALLLVLAWRAEEVPVSGRVRRWLDQVRAVRALPLIALQPLTLGDVRTMVASMLGAELPGVAETVAAQAQGHPLHAIELTHALVERGILRHGSQGWHLDAADAARLAQYTEDLVQTIVRRLEQLDESQREVLAIAAVSGRSFAGGVVRQVLQAETGADAEAAARRAVAVFAAAEQAQLIVAAAAQPGAHAFAHDKIREALYEALPAARRSLLHERIGDALAAASGQGSVYALAHHYRLAGHVEKAVVAAIAAGDLARRQYAHLEALEFYAQAQALATGLSAADRDALAQRLAEAVADSQVATGQLEAADRAYEAMLTRPLGAEAEAELRRKHGALLAVRGEGKRAAAQLTAAIEALGERVPRSRAAALRSLLWELGVRAWREAFPRTRPENHDPRLALMGRAYLQLTSAYVFVDLSIAMALHARYVNLMEGHNVVAGLGAAYGSHGFFCMASSLLGRADRYLERALAMRQAQGDRWGVAQTQSFLMLARFTSARWESGFAYGRACTVELEQHGDPYELNLAMTFLAFGLSQSGQWEESERLCERALRIAAAQGQFGARAHPLAALGDLAARRDLDRLLQTIDEVLAGRGAESDQLGRCALMKARGRTLMLLGRAAEAEVAFDEASALVLRHNFRMFMLADVLAERVHLLQQRARTDGAERAALLARSRSALRIARLYLAGLPVMRAALLRARATEYWLRGHARSAERLWVNAVALANSLGQPYQQALGLAEWGTALHGVDAQRSINLLSQARRFFIELGARHELTRWELLPAEPQPPPVAVVQPSDARPSSGSSKTIETERLRALVGVAQQLSATYDVNTMLQVIVDSAARLLGAERAMLYLWDHARSHYECRTRFGSADAMASEVSRSVLDKVLRTGEGAVYADAQADPGLEGASSVMTSGVRSILCAPLHHQHDVLGAIYLDNRLVRGLFGARDLELLEALASQAAISLFNARLYLQLEDHRQELEDKVLERTRELERAREAAEAATRAKGDFLANMSHEIRTPMNAILGMTHLALKSGLDTRQQNYVSKTQRAAQSLLGLINDILDFSKIEAGKLDMEAVAFPFATLFDDLADLLSMKAQEKGLELLYDLAPGLPAHVVGDPLRLRQVLVNLGNNAIKFTEQGEVTIEVREAARNADTVMLAFAVRDTGVGMTEAQCQSLFQPFVQADTSITRRYGGTGLGLAISRQLVELMHGKIGVDSRPGQGSRFHFTARLGLPAAPVDEAAQPAAVLKGSRLLIVDDNAAARTLLVEMADRLGMRGAAAGDAWDALRAATLAAQAGQPFDVVLIDRAMPGMDGIACAEQLQGSPHRGRPIVLMTPTYERDSIEHALAARRLVSTHWLAKPVTPANLIAVCRSALGHSMAVEIRAPNGREVSSAIVSQRPGARILLVEDNEINQELAVELLDAAGLHVTVAGDGQQAIELLARQDFDAVLMDCQMPVMDGYETTRAIRREARWQQLPIIAMTANAMSGDRERAIVAGMNDHIIKPIVVDQMFETIARWVR